MVIISLEIIVKLKLISTILVWMNYCVYILLLIALLFSVLINWFPKGIPQVVLLYKARRIMVNKKGQFKSQFEYKKFVNEPDTD